MQSVFKRKEIKYILTRPQYESLVKLLEGKMTVDKYGLQTVNNIYFDNDSFELIRRSIEKPPYKEKMRMRVYGTPTEDSPAFFELKKKYKGIVYKRRISVPLKEVENYYQNGVPVEDSQIFREIDYVYKVKELKPKLYLAYDRVAYFGNDDKNFRMTFDFGIRYRWHDVDIKNQGDTEFLLDEDLILMEVKCQLVYPRWFIDFLNENKLGKASFSKYGRIYLKKLSKDREKIKCIA